jgi:hypothetical protein
MVVVKKSQGENSMHFNERVETRGLFSSLYFVKIGKLLAEIVGGNKLKFLYFACAGVVR